MKTCSRCSETKPLTEFHQRAGKPCGHVSACRACKAAMAADYRSRNPDATKARALAWHNANKERSIANTKAWQAANAEAHAATRKAYRKLNAEEVRAKWRAWRDANRDVVRRLRARRRAALKLAVPAWADQGAIGAVYSLALHLSQVTGIEHHVDHVIPLQHPRVCGLHVEHNLKAIPKADNQRKYNKFEGN